MKDKTVRHCWHCNNTTLHEVVFTYSSPALWDHVVDPYEDASQIEEIEPIRYYVLECSTCKDFALVGGFVTELPEKLHDYPVLYPESREFPSCVPKDIRKAYIEAIEIRLRAPNAFAGQIRKALEILCNEQNASGKTLAEKLRSLVAKGVLPATLAEMTDIIREIGNAGVHAIGSVSFLDTGLIDDFFRSIVEYVYVAPDQIRSIRERLLVYEEKASNTNSET
jgi:hypothetical protein